MPQRIYNYKTFLSHNCNLCQPNQPTNQSLHAMKSHSKHVYEKHPFSKLENLCEYWEGNNKIVFCVENVHIMDSEKIIINKKRSKVFRGYTCMHVISAQWGAIIFGAVFFFSRILLFLIFFYIGNNVCTT